MKSCALRLAVDGSKDDKTLFFEESKKTSDGKKSLENQMKLSSTCELNEDAFTHTEEDIIAAAPSFSIIDENDDKDVNIEVALFIIIVIFDILVAKKINPADKKTLQRRPKNVLFLVSKTS